MLSSVSSSRVRHAFSLVAGALALALVAIGFSAATTTTSAHATGSNPMSALRGFTVLTEGDATTAGSADHSEGSMAVGGDLVVNESYNLTTTHGGAALPSIEGRPTQLLVGGQVQLNVGGEAMNLNQGALRVGDPSGYVVEASQPARYAKASQTGRYVRMAASATIDDVRAPGLWATTFSGAFSTLRAASSEIAGYTASDATFVTMSPNGGDGQRVTLTPGAVNVLRVTPAQINAATKLWFSGAAPSATTPFIIDVTGGGSVGLTAPVLMNVSAAHVLWNFSGVTSLTFSNAASDYTRGALLAPDAAVTFQGNTYEGQIAAKTFTVLSGGEIHHVAYVPEIPHTPTTTPVAGSWSTTGACDAPSNALVVNAVTGVTYTWTQGGSGAFTSFSASDLVGTYAFTVSVTDPGLYSLGTNLTSFSVTFTAPVDCDPPAPVCIPSDLVSYTYDAATNSGTVTVPDPDGYDGTLCDPFWVTAVSWKFVGSTVWPQALDQNNPMPENDGSFKVDEPGTYSYGADVVCGQGDIYASFDAQPVPTDVLNGPNTPYAEHFLHDMGFSGPTPTYTVDTPGCNLATPAAPTVTTIQECGTDGAVVVGTGAEAVALTSGGTTVTTANGVVYTLTAGDGRVGSWEVTATPVSNRYFDGPQKVTYSGDLGSRTECVEATEPGLTPAVCDADTGIVTSAFVTIPATEHLEYRLGSELLAPGSTVDLAPGTHVVTVEAENGWTNTGAASFRIEVDDVPDCDDPVAYVAPVVTHEICDASTGLVSDATIEFAEVAHLTYLLDGVEIVGARTVTVTPGSHTITVRVEDGYYLQGTNGLTEKEYPITVSSPASCDDPVEYVAPTVVHEVCDAVLGGAKDGVVSFVLVDHLDYVFDGVPVTAADLDIERPAGTYELVVTAAAGYFIAGGGTTGTYSITIDEPGVECDELTTIPLDPFASPEECVAGSLDGDKRDGAITIVYAEHVSWQISSDVDDVKHPVVVDAAGNVAGMPGHTAFPYPAGSYHVWATADDGYFLTTPTSFAVTVHAPTVDCDLPTYALLPTGASWTAQQCTPEGIVDPTITVEPYPGVSYFIDGVLVTAPTTTVAPGTHLIEAVADDPTNTVETASWNPTLPALASALCGDLTTLALTGATPSGFALLAIVLLQLGLVLVAVRFARRHREGGPRHRAA